MSVSSKTVSVIIPVFNNGNYLNDTIQSVVNQAYKDFEIIVVDDGSTDQNTLQVLKEINHPQIEVFIQDYAGVSIARNYGIEKASGKYILPLDADDLLGDTFIEQAVDVLDKNPLVKVVFGDVRMFGKKHGMKKLPNHSLEMLLGQNTMVVTSMFRKADFLNTSGFNPNMNEGFEDWDFWLTLLESGGDVFKLDTIALHYRIKESSRNSSLTAQKMQKLRRQIYENHKELYARHFFDPLKSFEYGLLLTSKEYKLGKKLLRPLRILLQKLK
ncbi:MAG: glycosyltransferase family 2 protein [Bacteroidales bacterium]|nr:glycosyltransferase family 2 protein [Bacteroidales bacterium]